MWAMHDHPLLPPQRNPPLLGKFLAANEINAAQPPIELLRQSQNKDSLRLFVDLYGAQNMVEEYGVHQAGLLRERPQGF